jgi:hypothetical protein
LIERNKYYVVKSICFALLRSPMILGYTPTHRNETIALLFVALPLSGHSLCMTVDSDNGVGGKNYIRHKV